MYTNVCEKKCKPCKFILILYIIVCEYRSTCIFFKQNISVTVMKNEDSIVQIERFVQKVQNTRYKWYMYVVLRGKGKDTF